MKDIKLVDVISPLYTLSIFGEQIADKIAFNTMRELQKFDSAEGEGDINLWDDICIQQQTEDFSIIWHIYEEQINGCVLNFVEQLKHHEKLAVFFLSDEGNELYDEMKEDDKGTHISQKYFDSIITDYIVKHHVYSNARSYVNDRIRYYTPNIVR
jgi:hypothetical protein